MEVSKSSPCDETVPSIPSLAPEGIVAEVALGSSQAPEDSLLKNRPLLSQNPELLKHPCEHGRQYMEQ